MPPDLSLRGGRRPTWRPERAARGSALGVQSRRIRPHRGKAIGKNATAFPRLPRRFAPRNDTSGGCGGAPELSSGLMPLCKAVTDRRYRRNWSVRFIDALYELQLPSRDCHVASLLAMTIRGVHRFNDSLFIPQVHHRARLSAPLQLFARSVALIIHCRSIFFYCCGSFFPT